MNKFQCTGENIRYTDEEIISEYTYHTTHIDSRQENGKTVYTINPVVHEMRIKTQRKKPKTGLMLVGWGGNNGSTLTAVWLANKYGIKWETKKGLHQPNYLGSLVMSSSICLGAVYENGEYTKVNAPICSLLPFLDPNDLEIDGWDISNVNLGDAMKRAKVLDIELQEKLYPLMKDMIPRKAVYDPEYLSDTQLKRANNRIVGSLKQQLEVIQSDIKDFKTSKSLDKVIVLWTASTERYMYMNRIVHYSIEKMFRSLNTNQRHLISPSMLFAIASIKEGCTFINGSPQNTFIDAVIQFSELNKVHLCGDDFKTGQTKVKSALLESLIGSGLKPLSIVSYNHLGNNDGENLAAYKQFRSKAISQSHVIEGLVKSNKILYKSGEKPEHSLATNYVPSAGDTKKALDEYVTEICMGGRSDMFIYNICEDSVLAVSVMMDLVILSEICSRISIHCDSHDPDMSSFHEFQSILSLMGYMLKAPLTPSGEPVYSGLSAQRACIENFVRACLGLPPQAFIDF